VYLKIRSGLFKMPMCAFQTAELCIFKRRQTVHFQIPPDSAFKMPNCEPSSCKRSHLATRTGGGGRAHLHFLCVRKQSVEGTFPEHQLKHNDAVEILNFYQPASGTGRCVSERRSQVWAVVEAGDWRRHLEESQDSLRKQVLDRASPSSNSSTGKGTFMFIFFLNYF
jgi:hypothetical protein